MPGPPASSASSCRVIPALSSAGALPSFQVTCERAPTLHGLPVVLGHHGDPVLEPHHLQHAGHRQGLRLPRHAAHLPPGTGHRSTLAYAMPGSRTSMPKVVRAAHLGLAVQPVEPLADEPEVARILEGRLPRHRAGRPPRWPARRTPATAPMASWCTIPDVRAARRHGHAPAARRGRHEHRARGGPGLTHRAPPLPQAGADAGHLQVPEERVAEGLVGVGLLHRDPAPVAVELLGEGHREPGGRALAHLHAADDHGDGAVGHEPEEGVGGEGALGRRRPVAATLEVHGQGEPGAGGGGRLHEVAARHRHGASPAATWMARRIRW